MHMYTVHLEQWKEEMVTCMSSGKLSDICIKNGTQVPVDYSCRCMMYLVISSKYTIIFLNSE